MVSYIDHILIGLYIISVLWTGLRVKATKSSTEYIFAARKLTVPAFVMTLVSTWYGGILEVGRFTYNHGITTILIFGVFYYIAALLYAFIIVPQIKNSNFETIPQAILKTFGKPAGLVAALLILFISSPAPYVIILSEIINFLYGIPSFYGILICLILSITYTIRGGFTSVIKTDIIQFSMMFIGFLFILFFLYIKYGGISFITSSLPIEMLSFPGNLNWSYIMVWGFISLITFIDPNFYQRTIAGISNKDVQKGICFSIVFWFLFDLMSISVALYAATIIPNTNYSPYLELTLNILPFFIKGLFIISMISVVMSTIDSFLFISGCTFGKDIFPLLISTNKNNTIANIKLGITISGIVSGILCIYFNNALDIWYVSGSFAVSCIMIPLFCSLFKINLHFPLICIITPGTITLLWFWFGNNSIDPMYPGLITSTIFFVIFKEKKGFLNKT